MTTGGAEPLFVDTNILVFANVARAPGHQAALQALQQYDASGRELWISRQIVREYLATVTRLQKFGGPTLPNVAISRVRYFLQTFHIAEDNSNVTDQLLVLLQSVPMGGKQIHDANIVATMLAYGIRHLLTHNIEDFARFAHLITVVPLEAVP